VTLPCLYPKIFPTELDKYTITIAVAITKNDAVIIIKYINPNGRNNKKTIGPHPAIPQLIPSTIQVPNEGIFVGKLSKV
jgi:hypothetical protein